MVILLKMFLKSNFHHRMLSNTKHNLRCGGNDTGVRKNCPVEYALYTQYIVSGQIKCVQSVTVKSPQGHRWRNSHIYVCVYVLCDLILQGCLMSRGSGVECLKSDLVYPLRSTPVLLKPLLCIGLTPDWPKKKSFGETVNESLMTVW